MKFTVFALFPLLFWSVAQAQLESEMAPLYLSVGEQRVLPLGEFQRYSVSGNGALNYTRLPPGDRILLKAMKPGIATLFINRLLPGNQSRNETRSIRIEAKKNLSIPVSLYQSLNGLQETEAIEEGEHFILRGKIKNTAEATRVAYLRDQYPKNIIDQTEIEDQWLLDSERKIKSALQEYPSLKFSRMEGDLWVNGSLSHTGAANALKKKLLAIQPLLFTDIKVLQDHDPTIYFKVYLLEVKKDELQRLGVEWPEKMGHKIHLSTLEVWGNGPFDLNLDTLSQTGKVKVLSSPELVVRAPGQAEIFAGGELPIRQHSKFTDSVLWKNIGLSLKLEVQSVAGEQVRLNVETGLSFLDQDYANDKIPGVLTNHIKTQVDATMGKPLLLSGLLQEEMHDSAKGLPFLNKIPVLGKLFGSESYKENKSEFAAVLLPYSTLPPHPMKRIVSDVPKGFLPLPRESASAEELEILKSHQDYPWNVL